MKRKIMMMLLVGMLTGMNVLPVMATEAENTETQEAVEEEAATEEVAIEAGTEETATEEAPGIVIPKGNMVDVEVIDLSLHAEQTGEFTPVYAYENPFKGKDTSKGVVVEFYAKPTWEVHELGTIFAIMGSGAYDGRIYFTPGSYLGYNSPGFGGYFDANLYSYAIVNDYIKDGALIRIELTSGGFAVYANDTLCYDQTILDNPEEAASDGFTSSSDFSNVLEWISGAEALYFGYGSWWNEAGGNTANIDLSKVNFRLMDGTVVMDKLQADKDLVESLGGSVTNIAEESVKEIVAADIEVEMFDIESVEYEGSSSLGAVTALVVIVAVVAVVVVIVSCKKRRYADY